MASSPFRLSLIVAAMKSPDDRLGPLALSWLGASRVADLRSDSDDLAYLVRAIKRPLPVLPAGRDERELALLVIALRARDHARRLLALVANGG
jgi:hypothetical protein